MSDFTIEKEKHIEQILKEFDFHQVSMVMNFLDWTWVGSKNSPTISELRKEAKRLLLEVADSNSTWISTGGFKASKYDDHLELEFVISEWSSELLNYTPQYERLKKTKTRTKKLKTIEKLNQYENN